MLIDIVFILFVNLKKKKKNIIPFASGRGVAYIDIGCALPIIIPVYTTHLDWIITLIHTTVDEASLYPTYIVLR